MATNKFILSPNGNFRSFDAFNSWMTQLTKLDSSLTTINNLEGTTLEVRGSNSITPGLSLLYINSKVTIEGNDGNLSFTGISTINNVSFKNIDIFVNGLITLTNDVSFDNCNITVNIATGFLITGNNIIFNNCNINYTFDGSFDGSFISGQLSNPSKACILASSLSTSSKNSNINITNCKFTTPHLSHFPFVSFILGYEYITYYDIDINNNQFICSDTSVSDNRAVVAFTSTLLTTTYFPRLINVNISDNICNSEQLISISPTLNGSNKVASAISCINTKISNNVCGAINFFTVDIKAYITADPFLINTRGTLYIQSNSCRFIYTGFSSGFINTGANIGVITIDSSSNIVTGSTIISENVCSWIHTGIRNFGTISSQTHTFGAASIQIKNNKLTAYDPVYLNSYYDGITADTTAITVDNVVGG